MRNNIGSLRYFGVNTRFIFLIPIRLTDQIVKLSSSYVCKWLLLLSVEVVLLVLLLLDSL